MGSMQEAAERRSGGQPNDWVLLYRVATWEEVMFDDQGGEIVVQRCRALSDQTLSSYGRVFDPSKLRDVCRKFRDQRRFLGGMTGDVWKKLQAYDTTGRATPTILIDSYPVALGEARLHPPATPATSAERLDQSRAASPVRALSLGRSRHAGAVRAHRTRGLPPTFARPHPPHGRIEPEALPLWIRGCVSDPSARPRRPAAPPPPSPSRTKWTRRVPHPVLIGHDARGHQGA